MVAKETLKEFNLNVDFIQADARYPVGKFDTVVQNPPFGVVERGIDMEFLESAFQMADIVYSIHKSNKKSRELIENLSRKYNFELQILTEKFRLRQYYPWHRKRFHEFLVDIYMFKKI
jgi:putative methylase